MAKAKKNFRGRKRRMRAPDLLDVLAAIESIVSDTPTEFEKSMQGKISAVYRLAHSFNPRHCCHQRSRCLRKELRRNYILDFPARFG